LARFEHFTAPAPFALKVDRELRDGDIVDAAGGLQVIHAPGHTPGHIALYAKEHRVLFSGDAFGNYLGLMLPISMSTHDMAQAKRSIARLAQLDFDHALPGHGQPLLSRANEKLSQWSRRWL
jgi:glyoxylase-like metal-dependent hydrolase (beta-lactamase superfamily II)